MTMPRQYRAFTPEFCEYMHRHGGFPKDAPTIAWLQKHEFPCDRLELSALRLGRYAQEKYATCFIRMLTEPGDDRELIRASRVLADFAKEHGIPDIQSVPLETLISHTCTGVSTDPLEDRPRKQPMFDALVRGLQDLATFPLRVVFGHPVAGSSKDLPVRLAIEWVFVRFAQQVLPSGPGLSREAAIAAAEELLGIGFSDYVERAESWVSVSRWVLSFARRSQGPVAASILLPVRPEVYTRVRSGELATSDVTADDLMVPSHHFVFEALAENPDVPRANRRSPTLTMAMALANQHAALMRYGQPGVGPRFRFLAPAATPANRDRMLGSGWKATDASDPKRGFPYWEKQIDFETGDNLTPLEITLIPFLARRCGPEPPN